MPNAPAKTIVYVVDDDQGVLGSLRFLLETDGFAVRTFRSGPALLDAIDQGPVDCIVIDYKMPGMNGIDLARGLRERKVRAPIVMITGYPDETISSRASVVGVQHVVVKPHLEESLVWHIRAALEESGAAA
ncbi:response regulator [Rhodopseudomonas palustris]|jgi:FixJ family two-component response regulator|uniref:Response regulator n=1 Tax=Rhodopseudomonas palustris TaxID=1076 RepID=A0AAX3DWI6_RHOPL|nr:MULTISPECIES: response regulator [Rhodopseudomonas]AVT78272.1 two-component system response regulator [Rhodopseudomonas palustris]AVT83109.1 two-component system response regulator [Rhodopseudomonas palustris]NEV77244.1 response regulator [Rhodopseudomonas sp. BR0C11]NEW99394.1 response regulator [Rhodopseudomonas sp. BR0G17]QLH73190.1 response regulator [Rhodopseudomonas palustris]